MVQSEQALRGLAVLFWAFMTNSDGLVQEPDLIALIFQCAGSFECPRFSQDVLVPSWFIFRPLGALAHLQQICQLSHTQLKSNQ